MKDTNDEEDDLILTDEEDIFDLQTELKEKIDADAIQEKSQDDQIASAQSDILSLQDKLQ